MLSTIGSRGDVQPLVALASELSARGHHVRLCVPPDFRDWIASLGFDVVPIGPELRTFSAGPPGVRAPLSAERRRELADATVAAQFDTIAAAAEGCDAIVAATALQIAARSVAERMGIRYVFAAYCPIVLPSAEHAPPPLPAVPGQAPPPARAGNRELWALDAARFSDLFAASLNARRSAWGLAPVADVRSHVFTDRPWLAADPTLGPWPRAADTPVLQTGAWILPDTRPLPADLIAFLDSGAPPVYIGFGSMRAPQGMADAWLAAVRALGRRAVIGRGWANLSVEPGRDDVLAIDEVNQQALFTRVAAVVHHGGAGTTTAAALAGAPQVIVPQMYDQHYWARRVEHLGIGASWTVGHGASGTNGAEGGAAPAALERALQPDIASSARSLASAIRLDGARVAAAHIVGG